MSITHVKRVMSLLKEAKYTLHISSDGDIDRIARGYIIDENKDGSVDTHGQSRREDGDNTW